MGYFKQIGHADYYPNGGKSQPMCGFIDLLDGQCSHLKSIEFYAESLLTGNFKAKKCDSYKDFKKGKCDNGEVSYLGGYNVDKRQVIDSIKNIYCCFFDLLVLLLLFLIILGLMEPISCKPMIILRMLKIDSLNNN